MRYRQHPVSPDLGPWVERLWELEGTCPVTEVPQTIAPDGRMELIFHFGDPAMQGGILQPHSLITGQFLQALCLNPRGTMDAIGIRLRPEAGRAVMGIPCHEFSGRILPMEDVLGGWARAARERAGQFHDAPGRLASILDSLRQLVRFSPDPLVTESVRRIETLCGRGTVDRFWSGLGLSARQWERRFLSATGLTPKELARITRFQHAISLYEAGCWDRWADLAMECGFYDQSHLANEFRVFSGSSPESFFRNPPELTSLFLRRELLGGGDA